MAQTLASPAVPTAAAAAEVYRELGVVPVINARGNQTVLGGALLSPRVLAAMDAANRYFVDMEALLEQAGRQAAELLGCQAAYVTPGCAAALTLGTAACIAGDDGPTMERLPDAAGLMREVVIQAPHRYKYDRAPTVAGAVLREAGDASGTTAAQLAEALGPQTAAVLFPAHLDGRAGTVSLDETLALAHDRGVPVLVDAAAQIYPVERMRSWTQRGADLVAFGAKYFGAPHSTGLLCGRSELVDSAARQGFIGFERGDYRTLGRPFKLDRGEIIAVVVALREWVGMDHGARIARVGERVDALVRALAGLPGVTAERVPDAAFGAPGLRLRPDPAGRHRAADLAAGLEQGSPSIVAGAGEHALRLNLTTVVEADDAVIAERLRALLAG
jgi:D-glucosaminate-6-phosphate ammonia-lyase